MTTWQLTRCLVTVRGHLDDHWSDWLDGLAITRHENGTSTLTGCVADQTQLHGVLSKLRDLGVDLIRLETQPFETPATFAPGS